MSKEIKNISASVHARLLDHSRKAKINFNDLLQFFAMDRFLYRWSKTGHANLFVLKGALMLRVWNASETRPTRDIDMLGKTKNDERVILEMINDIAQTAVEPDGLRFDHQSITIERITEDADYHGLRVIFNGFLGHAEIPMQIDIGFGDIIYPSAKSTVLPSILGFPPATLFCYSRESSIAEKLEAAISLGSFNSRMKDFFDIWTLSRQFNFESSELAEAIRLTFHQRNTALPENLALLDSDFAAEKQPQWSAFRKRIKSENVPESFEEVVGIVVQFISPVLEQGIIKGQTKKWLAPGPWR